LDHWASIFVVAHEATKTVKARRTGSEAVRVDGIVQSSAWGGNSIVLGHVRTANLRQGAGCAL
jgi:hypothetical protein